MPQLSCGEWRQSKGIDDSYKQSFMDNMFPVFGNVQ